MLINKIINDSSTEKPKKDTQLPSADILPKPSLHIVAEKVPPSPLPEDVAELFKACSDESQTKTEGDIAGYNETDEDSIK